METPDLLQNNMEEWLDDYYRLSIEVMEIANETETVLIDSDGLELT